MDDHDRDERRTPGKAALAAWSRQRAGVLRLRDLRHRRGPGLPEDLLPGGQRLRRHRRRVRDLRRRLRRPPDRLVPDGPHRRPAGPQEGHGRHPAADGRLDLPGRLPADVPAGGACSHRSSWSCCGSSRASPPPASRPAPTRCPSSTRPTTGAASSPASRSAAPRAARCSPRPSSCRWPRCSPRTSCSAGAGGSRSGLSAVVVVVGLLIRRRLDETPEFEAEVIEDEVTRAPLTVLFARPLAGRPAGVLRGVHRDGQHDVPGLRAQLRDLRRLRHRDQQHHDAVAGDRRQPRRDRDHPVLGPPLRPGRPQAGLRHRADRQRRPRHRLPRRHRRRQRAC